jgi:[ribosomal protein S5]-alanine N-acetyltransferase
MMMKPAVGHKVVVREHVLADRDAYASWQCDPEVAEFLSWLPKSEDESYRDLQDAIQQQGLEDRTRFYMAVVRHRDHEIVGDVGMSLPGDGSGDIGWFIRRKYWGMGYASEAASLMIRSGFEEIGLDTIRASCRRENARSERVMQRHGFVLTHATDRRLHYALEYDGWISAHTLPPAADQLPPR